MMTYWPAIIISVLMHGILLVVLVWGSQFAPKKTIAPPPSFIKASLVSVEAASKPKATQVKKEIKKETVKKAPPKKVDLSKQRQEQERLQKLAAEKKKKDQIAKQKAEQAAKEKQAKIAKEKAAKLAAEKAAEEAKIKEEQEQLRLQAEQERQEQLKQERERLRKEEEEQTLLASLAKEREQLDAEIAAERAARQAAEDEVAKQSYSALIQKRVTDAWSRPPSARNDMIVELAIELIPTGEVINVNVSDSSGNAAFDRSAVRAVNRVGSFPELREMPRRLFDAEFRSFKLNFSPEDLRQ